MVVCLVIKFKGGGRSVFGFYCRCSIYIGFLVEVLKINSLVGLRVWFVYGRWKREVLEVSVLFIDRKGVIKDYLCVRNCFVLFWLGWKGELVRLCKFWRILKFLYLGIINLK